jgi:hypothetical protein
MFLVFVVAVKEKQRWEKREYCYSDVWCNLGHHIHSGFSLADSRWWILVRGICVSCREFRWQISQALKLLLQARITCVLFSVGERQASLRESALDRCFSFVDLPTAEMSGRGTRESARLSLARRRRNPKLLPILVDLFVNQSACPVIN